MKTSFVLNFLTLCVFAASKANTTTEKLDISTQQQLEVELAVFTLDGKSELNSKLISLNHCNYKISCMCLYICSVYPSNCRPAGFAGVFGVVVPSYSESSSKISGLRNFVIFVRIKAYCLVVRWRFFPEKNATLDL